MLIHVVRQNPHMRMLDQNIRQRFQFVPGIGRTCRIGRRVENEPFGVRCDRGLKLLAGNLVIRISLRLDSNRCSASQKHDIRITHPVRCRDDDLIPRIERGDHGIVDDRLAARCHKALGWFVVDAVLALEFCGNGLLQFRDSIHGGVFRLTTIDCINRRLLDVIRRIEIRFACAKTNHITARSFQLPRLVCNRYCGRWLNT